MNRQPPIRPPQAMAALALLGSFALGMAACGNEPPPAAECLEPGVLGCPCLNAKMCHPQSDGSPLVCRDDLCQLPICGQGGNLTGCACGGGAPCASGLVCTNGRCAEDSGQTLTPPAEPLCYTPCQGGSARTSTGELVDCGEDFLLAGCIGAATCVNGSCVVPPEECGPDGCIQTPVEPTSVGQCSEDVDCPSFQACIQNQCYSDCESDSECRDGRVCYRKTCRVACKTADDSETQCPAGTLCESEDGQSGHCMPIVAVDRELPTNAGVKTDELEEDAFIVEPSVVRFSARRLTGSVTFTNDTGEDRLIVVQKVSHTEFVRGEEKLIENYPMPWLSLGTESDAPAQVQALSIQVPAGTSRTLELTGAENPALPRWTGLLEVTAEGRPTRRISLQYAGNPEGHWSGRVHYVANFGTRSLDAWRQNRSDRNALKVVGNALVRRWGAFRERRISWDEFTAALTATESESWRWESVKSRCPSRENPNPNAACYLYDNALGIAVYSDNVSDAPVPTGAIDVPIAMNLRADDPSGAPGRWTGRIVSEEALQYAGNPAVALTFASDPGTCGDASTCVTFLDTFSADVLVGGRYLTDAKGSVNCDQVPGGSFEAQLTPWLVPGFTAGTDVDVAGNRYRYECRDSWTPLGRSARNAPTNRSLAGGNPIPDGASRVRRIRLIDGALINQELMFILFEERFPSFLDANDEEGFVAYGYMVLRHGVTNLSDADFAGSQLVDARPAPGIEPVACSAGLLRAMSDAIDWPTPATGESPRPVSADTVSRYLLTVIQGSPPAAEGNTIAPSSAEKVHYFCEDTNSFSGGPALEGEACPAGSAVTYFTLQGPQAEEATLRNDACHRATCSAGAGLCGCAAVLANWIDTGAHAIRLDPAYRCEAQNRSFCSDDRRDLRKGKVFFAADFAPALFQPLDELVQSAFRYRVKFQNRSGQSVGFAPQICVPNSDDIPYCYAPSEIESITERVDCAVDLYTRYFQDLTPVAGEDVRSAAKDFLTRSFAATTGEQGFEFLNAELLIMLGDEAFTSAFKSRFDLARQNLAAFAGSLFEPGGIDLEGGAGFEMYRLYQAIQYYQFALDRFYGLSPRLWQSLSPQGGLPSGEGFVTPATVVTYFDRLIRASSQKARASSEIAKRYQRFNRPDLARFVIERAYTASYLESVVLARMMLRVVDSPSSSHAEQVRYAVEQAQRTYRAALLEMANTYRDIGDDLTVFGFAPDYIPFPVLGTIDRNAFTVSMSRANERVALAKEKELRALEDNRAFESSSALFQSELASITRNYEQQLAEICGTFTLERPGNEATAVPAIPIQAQFAPEGSKPRILGNPCGLMGNGALYDAAVQIEKAQLRLRIAQTMVSNIEAQATDAQARVNEQCQRISDLKAYRLDIEDEQISYRETVTEARTAISTTERALEQVEVIAQFLKCSVGTSTDCPTGVSSSIMYTAASTVARIGLINLELQAADAENEIAKNEKRILERTIQEECDALEIDGRYTIRDLMRRASEARLEAIDVGLDVRLALSQIEKLSNQATALMDQMNEALEMAIDIEASRNDPNVRIYRNDAVLAADRTFQSALQQAYRATLLYEYYTSQSYAPKDQLALIRMVSYGDFTLESYLSDLSEAFLQFEEQFGEPDLRVERISLMDDIFGIPELGSDGTAVGPEERKRLLRERIGDVSLLDDQGYISIPFSTSLDRVSPLTANHKIQHIEVMYLGSVSGDVLGRVYLRQRGTGVIRTLAGDKAFYAFPERTAVVDAIMGTSRFFPNEVYQSERFRDRPLVNTGWELVLNQKDEFVNQDIDLSGINDILIYIYYTDFTGV